MDNTITNGLVILGKIFAILFIIGGILYGLYLVSYGFMAANFDGEKTTGVIGAMSCAQELDMMMKPQVTCDIPIAYLVDKKPMTTVLNDVPLNAINPNYPINLQYEKKDPSKVSLVIFDKKKATASIITGVIVAIVAIYIGMWIYRTDALSSILGIGQLGRFIIN